MDLGAQCLAPVTHNFSKVLTARGGEWAPSPTWTLELKPPWRPAHSREIGTAMSPKEGGRGPHRNQSVWMSCQWRESGIQQLTGNASGSGMSFLSVSLSRKIWGIQKDPNFILPATKLMKWIKNKIRTAGLRALCFVEKQDDSSVTSKKALCCLPVTAAPAKCL